MARSSRRISQIEDVLNFSEAKIAVVIPAYNSGSLLLKTVRAVLEVWRPIWVVLDGTTDDSAVEITRLAAETEALHVLRHERNEGKGQAVLDGMRAAAADGFSHAVTMDADGQHAPRSVSELVEISRRNPEAMILGEPVFGRDAPWERIYWRRLGNFLAGLETGGGGIGDSLFGLRLYPIAPFLRIMDSIPTARRFDFDTEIAVRLFWEGVRPVNHPAPVFYPPRGKGGTTHFRYLRDNLLLCGTHLRLLWESPGRLRRMKEQGLAKHGNPV